MKHLFKSTIIIFLSLLAVSCSDDDETITNAFDENINADRFTGIEIGSAQFILPKSNGDAHIEFDYKGNSKVTKIIFDVKPMNVTTVGKNEFKWELENHIVPEKYYKGKINPHIHYHIEYPETENNPKARPAVGTYKFKITVEHEDGSKSAITKELKVMEKFKDLEVGSDNKVTFGSEDMHVEYKYLTSDNTIANIKHRVWFKEWRDGQSVEKGKWNKVDATIPESEFKGKKDPEIHTHFELLENMPKGDYWFTIYVTETGQAKPIKLSVPFKIN